MPRACNNVFLILACVVSQPVWAELPETVIQQTFHPYAAGKPSANGLAPGTTISQASWEAAKDYLPSEILDKVKAGELSLPSRKRLICQ